jgi:hypothetical protein
MRVGVQSQAPVPFITGKNTIPVVQEATWTPGPVLIVAQNLTPTGVRFPDRPARSESLYRLSYLGQLQCGVKLFLHQ